MNLEVGRYVIKEEAFWSKYKAKFITIVEINLEEGIVIYFYDDDSFCRKRGIEEFSHLKLIKSSPLMEELI